MHRSSSLLDVFSLRLVSAAPAAALRRKWAIGRSELMLLQLRHGKTPCAELVPEPGLAELEQVLPPRGQRAKHASYRVSRLEGRVLHANLLLPRRRSMPVFFIRVRHPDGAIERLLPVDADGLVTEAPLAIRLKPGTTVIEIEGCGRVEVVWR
jgi:hypothetical protein